MHIQHSIIQLAGHSLQRVDFDPLTFQPEDLLWLPHHARLSGCVRKRQSEHLAGRIAAVYALLEVGEKGVPAIGDQRQPLWPAPWYGSISHSERSALAVVSARPVGVDIERVMAPSLAAELESSIINSAEKKRLDASGLPPELALTLAFSAKESAFKASHSAIQARMGFSDFEVTYIKEENLRLRLSAGEYRLQWIKAGEYVITICAP
ncbi:enterobactin synthase subunit EntD [Klebsiella grimontii]|uniref:Enterobactin synthase component D n=1 Tax=Klebsiella grimontii TaxID=2058152 RepID=A0ABU9P1Q3_9ENTR|nr:enterobactin synthase subunit EntD [Klebsiella grimontii]MDU1425637.1 enterobactin synthase subunit EntD [Klebsiella michiganensis]MBZ6953052.1 enterobactin synthase subunit EntD [Klebsiella grimontii]MDU4543440.1 enterobactin synthase subunit EntD [Klebsiella michiganensis]MDU6353580.1 enterobactin synthase subunit EntD [Klebsiella grimontii]MDU6527504.1 enterobactin synthase subunit EntD [Klebsiella grimontii]